MQDIAEELSIQVWDEDTLENDLIAQTAVPVASLWTQEQSDSWIELQFEGKPSGKIHVVS